ncbi:hypothetical protein JRQ81_014653 [Phrynocephalus forsythii]|uniref:Uncharacterized protein n=1 Tax=Phrynocephalus forsythii TaxID=171643 RepID=A0A9Q1B3W9_9SAUR|nr:hypothetical protein JRQ81_014653 [Phrynocephalus forsythii]
MAAYSKFLTARYSTMAGATAAACAVLCLLSKRRKAAACKERKVEKQDPVMRKKPRKRELSWIEYFLQE